MAKTVIQQIHRPARHVEPAPSSTRAMQSTANQAHLASKLCDDVIDHASTRLSDVGRCAELIASARAMINAIGLLAGHHGGEQKRAVQHWLLSDS